MTIFVLINARANGNILRVKKSDISLKEASFGSLSDNPIHFHLCLKVISSFVILVYLVLTAVFVIIDSVATVTFRWKEYGELSFRHTDATSVLFLLSKSRWKLRLLTCLTIASAASLQTTQVD